jgi:hypothetical protein
MRNKHGLILLVAAFVLPGWSQTTAAAGPETPPPLIRRDLLNVKSREFPPVKRDLFSGQTFFREAGGAIPGSIVNPAGVVPAKEAPELPVAPTPPAFSLRYVGFIHNRARAKIVGLVMFEGQFVSVEEGDLLGQVWKVVRITAEGLDVEGPDGALQTFVLEGDIR